MKAFLGVMAEEGPQDPRHVKKRVGIMKQRERCTPNSSSSSCTNAWPPLSKGQPHEPRFSRLFRSGIWWTDSCPTKDHTYFLNLKERNTK